MARSPVLEGVLRALALAPGIAPLGVVFGATAVKAGLPSAAAVFWSASVFAAGAQFAAVAGLVAGGGVLAVAGLAALVNSRYFLMSAATLEFGREARATRGERAALALGTIDEGFALQAAWCKDRVVPPAGLIAVSATLWVFWVAGTAVGAFVGQRLPPLETWGLDYIFPGLFIGLFSVFADTRPRLVAGLVALAAEAVLVVAGLGTAGLLVVPLVVAFALGFHELRREGEAG